MPTIVVESCRGCSRSCRQGGSSLDSYRGMVEEIARAIGFPPAGIAPTGGKPPLPHHKLTISISGCPNSCSRPQIADIGIVFTERPSMPMRMESSPSRCKDSPSPFMCLSAKNTQEIFSGEATPVSEFTGAAMTDGKSSSSALSSTPECCGCNACVAICPEQALQRGDVIPTLDHEQCLACGICRRSCLSGCITVERAGVKILIGGRLGRHPRLAEPAIEFVQEDASIELIRQTLQAFTVAYRPGLRMAALLEKSNPGLLEVFPRLSGRCATDRGSRCV